MTELPSPRSTLKVKSVVKMTFDFKSILFILKISFRMLSILVASIFLKKTGYYGVLIYFSLSLSYFLVQTLKKQIYSVTTHEHVMTGNKRRLYFLLTLAGVQPILMWLLTYHIAVW